MGSEKLYLPTIYNYDASAEAIIPDTTVVIPITTTQYLEKLSGDYTFTFSQWTPALQALEPGDVMVGDVSPGAPEGFLRKVKSVEMLCDKIVVTTEFATLEEAVQSASIRTSQTLKPSQVIYAEHAEGVSMAAAPDGIGFQLTLEDVVLYDDDKDFRTKYDQITADGSFALDIGAEVGIDISWFQLRQFRFIVNATETSKISVNWKYAQSIKKEIPIKLSFLKFTPFTIMAGPVPVVIQPEIGLSIDIEGNVSVGVSAAVTQQASLRVGAISENGHWSGVHEFNNSFTFDWPWEQLTLSGGVSVAFNPELTLKPMG